MSITQIDLVDLETFDPIVVGSIVGEPIIKKGYKVLSVTEDSVNDRAIIIELFYNCTFYDSIDDKSFVKLSVQSTHRIHHTVENFIAVPDLSWCIDQCSHNLRYVTPESGLVLVGSHKASEPLPQSTT